MAPTNPQSPRCTLLTVPLEIRRCIYGFCIPKNLTFDCSDDMYYQNRPTGWIEPPWHSNGRRDEYASSEDAFRNEVHYLRKEWTSRAKSSHLETTEAASMGEDSLEYGMKENNSESWELDSCDFTFSSLEGSAFPALLLLCHQINDEVETMLYQANTFTIDIHDQHQDHIKRQFTPRKRERMRNIILVIQPDPPKSPMDREIWDTVLGNVLSLGVSVKQPEQPLLELIEDSQNGGVGNCLDFLDFVQERKREAAAEWMTWLMPIFEYLVQAIPQQTEIVVDVAEEEDTVQALDFFQKGPFRFQKLPTADSMPRDAWFEWQDEGPTSCRDIINDSDYDYYYSD
ncbi:hypothetical protein F4859DRAFT_167961 [Xylaria cf. heliscus]|nr:hypothetical protein F4859DRAFT_167961 [Xylaria cf. heliscus]